MPIQTNAKDYTAKAFNNGASSLAFFGLCSELTYSVADCISKFAFFPAVMEDVAAVGKNPQETPPTLALEAGAACGVSILSRVTCEANAGSHSLSFHGSVVLRLKLVDL